MRKWHSKWSVILLALAFPLVAVSQQAWVQEKGTGYLQAGYSSLSYNSLHNGNNDAIILPRDVQHSILSIYGEYGIAHRLMLRWNVPFHITKAGASNTEFIGTTPIEEGTLSAFGNLDLGLAYSLLSKDGTAVSLHVGIAPKTASADEVTGLRTGYDAAAVSSSIAAGYGSNTYFLSAELGAQLLTSDYLNRLFFKAQVGTFLGAHQRWTTIFGLDIQQALGTSDGVGLNGSSIHTGLYLNEQSFLAANLKIGYQPTTSSYIWLSAAGGIAKNVGRGIAFSLAIATDIK
ncbi:MAG: hypothetical protein KTR24_10130 [Saprospiraceae bacterium]|nr:hypothetical protein [Saprospiraceae bacterium]